MMRTILLAALAMVPAGGDAPVPLQPVTPWHVEYASRMCMASRTYGEAAAPLTVGVESGLLNNSTNLFVIGDRRQIGSLASVAVAIRTPARLVAEKVAATRRNLPERKAVLLSVPLKPTDLDSLVDAPAVTIQPAGGPPIVLALSMRRSLVDALQKCRVDTLKSYGFDPAKVAAVATPAESVDPAAWLTHDDYPAAAFNAGQTGRVLFGWKITADGRVADCRIIESSGVPELDRISCAAITQRGRYRRPALDAAGKPVASYAIRFAGWALPR